MKARKANPLIKAINDQITSYKRDANAFHQKSTKLAKDRMLIRALYAPLFVNFTRDDQVFVSIYGDRIHFNVYMRELDSFKDERLLSILNTAMETISDKVKEQDYAQYDHKEYYINTDDVNLCITAYVKEDSPTCKKIMTGMEVKEVPTYKFVCE
jgi:hypothetical protein